MVCAAVVHGHEQLVSLACHDSCAWYPLLAAPASCAACRDCHGPEMRNAAVVWVLLLQRCSEMPVRQSPRTGLPQCLCHGHTRHGTRQQLPAVGMAVCPANPVVCCPRLGAGLTSPQMHQLLQVTRVCVVVISHESTAAIAQLKIVYLLLLLLLLLQLPVQNLAPL